FGAGGWPGAALGALAVLAAITFLGRPFEMLVGGRDATTYLVGAIGLARQGSLVLEDRAARAMGPEVMKRIHGPARRPAGWGFDVQGVKYQGFFYVDPERSRVIAQGCHLLPALIAIFYLGFGLAGALAANNFLAILAVSSVFVAGSELVGTLGAFIGAALLSVSLVEVWTARYPVAEILVQMLLFSGFAALLKPGRLAEGVAGLLLGAVFFTKVEAVLLLVPAGALAVADLSRGRPFPRKTFWSTFVPAVLVAVLYWLTFQPDYLASVVRILSKAHTGLWKHVAETVGVGGALAIAGAVGASAIGLWAVVSRITLRGLPAATGRGGVIARWLAAGAVLLTAYGYLIRPFAPFGHSGAEKSLVWLTWYATPVVVFVGMAALVVTLWRRPPLEKLVVLGALLLFSFTFLQLPFVNLRHIYMTRRFVPAVLPTLFLFFGSAVVSIPAILASRR
ncbi:MAG: hypothetical protein ACREQ9_08865, partial [Candidatus Binatia bacterium]